MKKVLFFASIFLLGLSVGGRSQSYPESLEDFNEGQYFFNRGDFEEAVFFFLKLVEYDSANANFNFKVGECYLNIPGKEQLAVPYFEIAVKKVVPKKEYNKRIYGERNAPLHAYFYLGNAYRIANKLNKALECYEKFIDSPYFWGNYNQGIVEQEMKSCERAKIIQDAPTAHEKINAGDKINSDLNEIHPVISGDGQTMVFIRRLKFYDAIFFSAKNNENWSEAVNINPQVQSDGEFFPTGLSFDGKQLLLIKKEQENSDIYISMFEEGTWTVASKLAGEINSRSIESFASFSKDGKTIYLSSDRAGGLGGFDIYLSQMNSDKNWSKPKNAGKVINTEFDDQNPILCNNDQLLFFTSKGHYNMGGFDIFYSRKGKKWSLPINLGYPINNTGDNFVYYPFNGCREGYMSIGAGAEEGYGGWDIYLIKIQSNSVLTVDEDSGTH